MPSIALDKPGAAKCAGGDAGMCHTTDVAGAGCFRETAWNQRPGISAGAGQGEHSNPIIFITGHGDIPMTVRDIKSGAVEFLTKPFRNQELLEAINQASGSRPGHAPTLR